MYNHGNKTTYTCDEPGCNATATFGSSSSLDDLTRGGWLTVPQIGGVATYCPKHRGKYDLEMMRKEFGEIFKNFKMPDFSKLGKIKIGCNS